MDLPQSTPHGDAVLNYEQMDFSDISSDFPDIMMTTSDNDIPDLVDILNIWITCNMKPGLHKHSLLTLPKKLAI